MYKITLSFLLLLSLSGMDNSYLFAQTSGTDNPIMVIRCRFQREALTSDDTKNTSKAVELCPLRGGSGILEIPNTDGTSCIPKCFNGEVKMDFEPLDCSAVASGDVIETTLCFTSADSETPLEVGQHITFSDIENCLDADGQELINGLSYDPNLDQPGFAAAQEIDGVVKVCATFFINPEVTTGVSAKLLTANGVAANPEVVAGIPCLRTAAAIPTLTQWSLFILSLMTCCLALVFMLKGRSAV